MAHPADKPGPADKPEKMGPVGNAALRDLRQPHAMSVTDSAATGAWPGRNQQMAPDSAPPPTPAPAALQGLALSAPAADPPKVIGFALGALALGVAGYFFWAKATAKWPFAAGQEKP